MKRQLVLLPLLLSLITPTYASTNNDSVFKKPFVLELDIGQTQTNQMHSVTFPLGYSTFNYVPQNVPSSTRYGISLSRKLILNSLNNILIGLSYHQFSSATIKGTLEQGISSPYYNANYQYTIRSSQVLAERLKRNINGINYYIPTLQLELDWEQIRQNNFKPQSLTI